MVKWVILSTISVLAPLSIAHGSSTSSKKLRNFKLIDNPIASKNKSIPTKSAQELAKKELDMLERVKVKLSKKK